MIIFSVTVFPILCIFINSILNKNYQDLKFYRITFIKGILTFIPFIPVIFMLAGVIRKTNSLSNIYLYHFIYDFAFYYAAVNFGYAFLFKNSMIYRFREKISEIITFECGFFTALSVFDGLYIYKWESPYLLFILPCSRIVLVLLFSILTPLISESTGILKILYAVSLFLLPFAVSFISFFYYTNSFLISLAILSFFMLLAAWLFYNYSPVIKK